MREAELSFAESLKRARSYGLGEFLELLGELSQESTKKGLIDRKNKEFVTLGIALAKGCHRCIHLHTEAAVALKATHDELLQVNKIVLFIRSSPVHDSKLWDAWEDAWREFAISRGPLEHRYRELVALGIALVQQDARRITLHTGAALDYGALPDAVFEVMPIALLMDGAPALSQVPQLVHGVEQWSIARAKTD